ncbi:MAG: hypothetical protein Q4A06_05350 [Cardiobacteriaceae bacterium]|nr:hypothetical protein [Cardiobacteriaceae bacterium]
MIYKTVRHLCAIFLVSSLFACQPPAPRDAHLDLCTFVPPGAEDFHWQGDIADELDNSILLISDISRGEYRGERDHCSARFSAKPEVNDDMLIAQIEKVLGEAWHYRGNLESAYPGIRIHLWQTHSRFWPNRHYGLASYQATLQDENGQPFRPIYSVHISESTREQHGSVVLVIIASSFLIPAAALMILWRVRHNRRS